VTPQNAAVLRYLTPQRFAGVSTLLLLAVAMTMAAAAMIGPEAIQLREALQSGTVDHVILFQIRLPRVLLGLVVGGALGASGAALQALLRNPLAEPHIIGVSGGAALGGVLTMLVVGRTPVTELSIQPLGSFAGALLATALVVRLGTLHGHLHPYTLLLAGVVCNAVAGSLIMFINSIADFYQAHGIIFWLMGSLATQSYRLVVAVSLYAGAGLLVLAWRARQLNVLSLGDEEAWHLGIDVERTRRTAFAGSALLVGAVVAVSGMIGFVGLIVPHVVRLLLGSDNRLLVPASFLAGGVALVWADTAARTVLGSVELPVGVVTALCGGPFFVWLLRRQGR
jgi:iron complex transport system permease protein